MLVGPAGHRRVVRLPAAAVRDRLLRRPARRRRAARSSATPGSTRCRWAVYCTAWTFYGSVGRAASAGVGFLPIYLGPTLAMLLAWMRAAQDDPHRQDQPHHLDRRLHRLPLRQEPRCWPALVTVIAVIGIVPYIALQLKAVSTSFALLTSGPALPGGSAAGAAWWRDSALYIALVLAGFTIVFGTRHLDATERHEGMVAAIAFESLVKLLAFLAVGVFVTLGLFDGLGDIFARALGARPTSRRCSRLGAEDGRFAYGQWFALTMLSMLVDHVPAAPVPDDGGRERRRAAPRARDLGCSRSTCC